MDVEINLKKKLLFLIRYSQIITIGRPANMTDTESYGILDMAFLQIYFDEPSYIYKRDKPKSMLDEPTEEETKSCMEKAGTHFFLISECIRETS